MKMMWLVLTVWLWPLSLWAAAPDMPAAEVQAMQQAGQPLLIVDVRSPEEFAAGHVPGAINLPHDRLHGDEPVLKGWQDRTVVLYCRSGRRAALAADVLARKGFTALRHLEGDLAGWPAGGRLVQD